MTRKEATEAILKAKREKGLTWEATASVVGGHKVWVASVLLGQNSMTSDQAAKAASVLGLTAEGALTLTEFPLRGSLDKSVPIDQLIYRFH